MCTARRAMMCDDIKTIVPLPKAGYWRSDVLDADFARVPIYQCAGLSATEKCPGFEGWAVEADGESLSVRNSVGSVKSEQCGLGRSGPLCQVCTEGYVLQGGDCAKCDASEDEATRTMAAAYGVGCVVFAAACVALFYWEAGRQRSHVAHRLEEASTNVQSEIAGLRQEVDSSAVLLNLKIMLSWLQIMCTASFVFDALPWPVVVFRRRAGACCCLW